MTSDAAGPDDPVEQIFTALARIRGRRRLPASDDGRSADGPFPVHGPRGHHVGPGGWGERPPWADAVAGRVNGPARLRMLEALAAASHPLSVSALGEAIGVDQPRASRLVQQGVDTGLVRREADPDDARRTRIALTDRGHSLVHGFRGARRDTISTALAGFTDAERAEFARLLTRFADAWPR